MILILFPIFFLLRKLCQVATRKQKKKRCIKKFHEPIHYNVTVFRFLLEGCFGLGLASTIALYTAKKWYFNTVIALAMLITLILSIVYICIAQRRLKKHLNEVVKVESDEIEVKEGV